MVAKRTNQVRPKQRYGSLAALAVLLCGLHGLPVALGQGSGSVTVDVDECFALESAQDRIACFGAQVDAALEERDPPDPGDRVAAIPDREVAEDRATGDETPTRRERRAARTAERRAARQAEEAARQAAETEAATDEYFGKITAIRERVPNRYVITLDNGQIWEQVSPKRYPLRPGLPVRIYPSAWGESYRLTGESSGSYIQVRLLK